MDKYFIRNVGFDYPDIQLSIWTFVFGLFVSLIGALILGLIPSIVLFRMKRYSLFDRSGHRTVSWKLRGKLYSTLVIVQIALTQMILIEEGRILKSFISTLRRDPGFDVENIVTARLALPESSYSNSNALWKFRARLKESLIEIPGIDSVAFTTHIPGMPLG